MATTSPILALAWATTLAQFTGTDEINFGLATSENYSISASLHFQFPYDKTIQEGLEVINQTIRKTTANSENDSQQSLLVINVQGSAPDHYSGRSKQTVVICDLTSEDLAIQGCGENTWKCEQMVRQMRHVVSLIKRAPGNTPVAAITSNIHYDDLNQIQRWNGNELARHDACIHERITEQCRLRKDEIAICAWDGTFTYKELDELSSRFAALLQARGVQPEVFVPLYFTKSRWTTMAMLAVLKAGGAFVLLDPSHPPSRLRDMCRDVGAKLIVSSPRDVDGARTLNLPLLEIGPGILTPDVELKPPTIRPDNAAFICFTSGSTGNPKGAVMEHAMFSTVVKAFEFSLSSQSRVFQFAAYAFDAAVLENLGPLMHGGCTCIPSEAGRRDDIPGAFAALRANFFFVTPSVLQTLSPADMPGLEILLLGGEATTKALFDQWAQSTRLFHVYGPTECTVIIAAQGPLSEPYNHRVLGQGLGVHLWVADTRSPDQLAPVGAIGELVIEGPPVSRGYINSTGAKAAAFLSPGLWPAVSPQPYRAYRTGDLVHYIDSDGSIEFIGRKDTQVKIRGQRVEMGDVEHHLRQLYPSSHCVVAEVATPAARKGARPVLIAFINEHDRGSVLEETSLIIPHCPLFLSNWLDRVRPKMQASLPSYMVPTLALPISHMPLTLTGKTDRRRLRAIVEQLTITDLESYSTKTAGDAKQQPNSDTGRSIQKAVGEVLGLELQYVGIAESFIQLGGDSITAMKLAVLLRRSHIALSVGEILQHSDLNKLTERAVHFTNGGLNTEPKRAPFTMFSGTPIEMASKLDVREADILDVLPATELQLLMLPYPPQYQIIHIPGPVDTAKLKAVCENVVCRHEILRTVFIKHSNSLFQVILREVSVAFEHYECPGELSGLQTRLLEDDTNKPMPWNVPSTRFYLLSESDRQHTLIIRLTHAVYDAQSLPIILKDVADIYNGQPLSPPNHFSPWAYDFFASATTETYGFWKTLLEGSSMTYIGNPLADMEGQEVFVDVTRSFPVLEPPKGITLATLVKAAWSLTLSKYAQKRDVVFGQVVHGRGHGFPGDETVVGLCINMIPVRANLTDIENCEDLLHTIQEQNVDSIAHDRVQFKDIINRSTDWPRDTVFGTTLLHQGGGPLCALKFGSVSASLNEYYAPQPTKEQREFVVQSTFNDQTHTLQISTTNAHLDEPSANSMIDTLVFYVQELVRNPRAISCS
ncbi:nonribosomal peptide synthase [Arthroderma uncinatum]|uniref:nonribosomal peptide synthase n=1 Tax=Arthroderma uncinatum TaxID=74035 RepID=UPI00144A5BE7|nr:nonribosomal peptide synthase [Arthroderma uncinatum]KAF3481939.1 nonribosomal peptide synthase [Arthroderma uncinatum]